MGDYDDLKPLWLEAHQFARDQLILQARLGRGDAAKTLFVSNKPGYCWARIFAPEGVTQEMIRCRKVTAAYGAMVDVQRGRDGVYEAIGEASTDAAQAYWGDLGNGNVPRHGATHSLNGVDPVFLSAKQYKPLGTIPDTPASTSVYVNPAWYIDADGERQYFAGDTADLSSEIAALLPDEQQLVVIALDRSTGTLTKTAGTAEAFTVSNVYGMPFEVADVTAITLADNLIPSQAVRIREGQPTIQLYDMPEAFDMRIWHGGQLSTGALTIEDALFTLQDDGDPTKQAQFQLSSITPGQTRTYTLPDLSDTIVTLTATQNLTDKTLTSPVIVGGTANNLTLGNITPAPGTFTTVTATGNIVGTGLVQVQAAASTAFLRIQAQAGQARVLDFMSASSLRWRWNCTPALESGSNAGSNLTLVGLADDGVTAISTVFNITRASSRIDVGGNIFLQNLSAAAVALSVTAAAGQTGNLFQVRNSSATVLSAFDSGGNLGIGTGASAPATELQVVGTGFLATFGTTSAGVQISNNQIASTGTTDLILNGSQGGEVAIGTLTPLAKLHVDQSSTTGAIPVLTVDQADVSEEFIRFIGTSANGVLNQSIVEAADVATPTIAGYLKIFVQDDGNQLTDQAYYVPIYTLA